MNLVASWEQPEENDDENSIEEDEDIYEDVISNKRELRLNQYLKSLIKRLALKTVDNKTKISGRSAELLALLIQPLLKLFCIKSRHIISGGNIF